MEPETIEQFVTLFNAALVNDDLDFLFSRLHPVAVQAAGPGVCEAFVESQFGAASALVFVGPIQGPSTQEFSSGQGDFVVDGYYTVPVRLTFQDQLFDVQLGYALVDDQIRWLSTCV